MTSHRDKHDLAFLENLNVQLVKELDASQALEKELRDRIEWLEFELETSNRNHAKTAFELRTERRTTDSLTLKLGKEIENSIGLSLEIDALKRHKGIYE